MPEEKDIKQESPEVLEPQNPPEAEPEAKDPVQEVIEQQNMVAMEEVERRIAPSIEILKELLKRAEQRRIEESQINATEESLKYMQQNAQVMVPYKEQIYVSLDGDNIGNAIMRAEEKNDETELKRVSALINAGQQVLIQWAQQNGGQVIEAGGDEGLVRVPGVAVDRIEDLRNQYEAATKATSTIGVGSTIRESTQARMLGKLRGKNTTVVFDESVPKELKLRLDERGEQTTEGQKIKESGLGEVPAVKKYPKYAVPKDVHQKDQDTYIAYQQWLASQKS